MKFMKQFRKEQNGMSESFVDYKKLNEKLAGLVGGNFIEDDKVLPTVEVLREEGLVLLQEEDPTQRLRIRNGESVLGIEFGITSIEDGEYVDVIPCELCIGFNSHTEEVTSVFLAEV